MKCCVAIVSALNNRNYSGGQRQGNWIIWYTELPTFTYKSLIQDTHQKSSRQDSKKHKFKGLMHVSVQRYNIRTYSIKEHQNPNLVSEFVKQVGEASC